MEATLIQAYFWAEDRVSVTDFDNRKRMSATVHKMRFVAEQLGVSMATNLINSVFHTTHGVIEMSIVLDTYEGQPSHSAIIEETS